MSTAPELVPGGEIAYEAYRTSQLIVALLVQMALLAVFVWGIFFSTEAVTENIWVGYIAVGAIGLGVIMTYKTIRSGARWVRMIGETLTVEYPEETLVLNRSSISDLRTRRRKQKDKLTGVVTFTDHAGTKRTLSFNFSKPHGLEAFVWFERIENAKKDV